jgi:hypothetical protein
MAKGNRDYRELRKEKAARCEMLTPSWDSFAKEARRDCHENAFNGSCTIKMCT